MQTLARRARRELGKDARRHQSQQLRQKKRDETFSLKRNLGGSLAAPVLITVIPLQEDLDARSIVGIIASADETATVAISPSGVTHIRYVFL